MLYLVKRVLPFMLTFAVGVAVAGIFSFSSEAPVVEVPTFGTVGSKTSCFTKKSRAYVAPAEDQNLQILSKPRPGYTDLARERKTAGTVVVRVNFLATGEIGAIEPVKTLGNGLTEKAIEAARAIEFQPKYVDGRPVSVTKQIEYTFAIY